MLKVKKKCYLNIFENGKPSIRMQSECVNF